MNINWSKDLNRLVIQSTGQLCFLDYSEIITITLNPSAQRALIASTTITYSISFDSAEFLDILSVLAKAGFIKINERTLVNLVFCNSIVEKESMYVLHLNDFTVINNVDIELIEARLKMQGIRHVYNTKRKDTKLVSLEQQNKNPFLIEKELFSQKVLSSFL